MRRGDGHMTQDNAPITVIFDLDGTLADTSGDLIAAANACFRGIGAGDLLDPTRDQATALRGGRAMLRLGFRRLGHGAEQIDALYPVLLGHYAAALDRYSTFFPGALAAVQTLRDRGARVGICTNKPHALAESLMQKMDARDLFHSLVGADTIPVRKPDPAPFRLAVTQAGGRLSRALLVGDTLTDHRTARAAQVPSVLVAFGPGDEDVEALNPDAVLRDFADLPDLAARLLRA